MKPKKFLKNILSFLTIVIVMTITISFFMLIVGFNWILSVIATAITFIFIRPFLINFLEKLGISQGFDNE